MLCNIYLAWYLLSVWFISQYDREEDKVEKDTTFLSGGCHMVGKDSIEREIEKIWYCTDFQNCILQKYPVYQVKLELGPFPSPPDWWELCGPQNLILHLHEVTWHSQCPALLKRLDPVRNNIHGYRLFIVINNNSAGNIFSFHLLLLPSKRSTRAQWASDPSSAPRSLSSSPWAYAVSRSGARELRVRLLIWAWGLRYGHPQPIFLCFLMEVSFSQYVSSWPQGKRKNH